MTSRTRSARKWSGDHKEYYLREQLKIIQDELGQNETPSEIEELRGKIEEADMPELPRNKALHELDRLSKMPVMSAEATVVRTYIDWLVALPWNRFSPDNLDIVRAEKVLEEDHYGLEKVKERILEFLAVRKLASGRMKGQVLCFVGPPGVGKTSLGKSIARALERKSSACPSAACGTRPRYGGTAEPTSAPCRGGSFRKYGRPG